MNKEYTYLDGKVIISDENNKKIQKEYYDNLDKVLVQENLIETMENKQQELEEESDFYKKYHSKHYIPVIFPTTALISTLGTPFLTDLLTNSNAFTTTVDTILGPMSHAMAITIPISVGMIPFGVALELVSYNGHKNSIKKEKGINSQLAFLKKQLKQGKEDLENLKKDKSRNNEVNKFRTVKVNDLEQLKILKEYLNLYYDLGYNGEKYYKYYQQGKLDNKLQKHYSYTGIQMAKDYMEEKGPTFVLKKKKNNTDNLEDIKK